MNLSLGLVLSVIAYFGGETPTPNSAERDFTPDPVSVRRYGPAYRYPQAGWIVLHIEGEPYERGYQHGQLLSREIQRYISDLASFRSKTPADGWNDMRMLCDALFLRKYDAEFLEEMKGIADGAAAAGAKFQGRALDLLDIVAINSDIEVEFLDNALNASPYGLEGRKFVPPASTALPRAREPHCSAFAATGPATADGKIVFGHITMWNLKYVRHFNVWLEVQPKNGQRVLMQTYPAGIQSGMDYYMNDAGLLVTETTIAQTKFEANSKPLASRIRKALQYSKSIDDAVKHLLDGNNGLYTNEWLLGDIKTNEVAAFELGTAKSKLWRSGKDEWVGGHKGFYWGCNNARDLEVRKETHPSMFDRPANLTFRPSDRDCKWLELFDKSMGKVDESFGFKAFTTPPLAAFSSLDAKFTTSDLAKDLKSWCLFGNPLGKTWEPLDDQKSRYAGIRPLVSNDWTLISAARPTEGNGSKMRLAADFPGGLLPTVNNGENAHGKPPAWRGTLLPKSDADIWLAGAFAEYQRIAAWDNANKSSRNTRVFRWSTMALHRHRAKAFAATVRMGVDVPPHKSKSAWNSSEWYDAALNKGVLMLDVLRKQAGPEKFDAAMDAFGTANGGKEVSNDQFVKFMSEKLGSPVDLDALDREVTAGRNWSGSEGPTHWAVDSFEAELDKAIIVIGTTKDASSQMEAANRLQRWIARKWSNVYLPIVRDVDLKDKQAAENHLLLIGRPSTNAAYAKSGSMLPAKFGPASFTLRPQYTFAHEETAVICVGPNPMNRRYSVVAFAGLSAEATWHCVEKFPARGEDPGDAILIPPGGTPRNIVLPPVDEPKPAPKPAAN